MASAASSGASEEAAFGKCRTCGRLRWVASEALKRGMGWKCKSCGSLAIRQTPSLSPAERCYLAYWTFWEHLKINPGSYWWLNPLNVYRVLRMGLFPKLHLSDPETDKQESDDDQRAEETRSSTDGKGKQEATHSRP